MRATRWSRMEGIDGEGPPEDAVASRLVYREDDDNFKRRLNSAIQMSWVFNTAITILVISTIFYALDYNMVMGIMLGVLLAMMSNLHLTLSRVTRASRWEVYKNRTVMPQGFRGGNRSIPYTDIDSLSRRTGLSGETLTIRLRSGESITLDVEEQRKPLEALDLAFRRFDRSRPGPTRDITIPIVEDEVPT